MKTILLTILTRAGTLNPQDNAVLATLHRLEYAGASGIRVGRCMVFEVGDEVNSCEFKERIEQDLKKPEFARFFNPITDECRIEER